MCQWRNGCEQVSIWINIKGFFSSLRVQLWECARIQRLECFREGSWLPCRSRCILPGRTQDYIVSLAVFSSAHCLLQHQVFYVILFLSIYFSTFHFVSSLFTLRKGYSCTNFLLYFVFTANFSFFLHLTEGGQVYSSRYSPPLNLSSPPADAGSKA